MRLAKKITKKRFHFLLHRRIGKHLRAPARESRVRQARDARGRCLVRECRVRVTQDILDGDAQYPRRRVSSSATAVVAIAPQKKEKEKTDHEMDDGTDSKG